MTVNKKGEIVDLVGEIVYVYSKVFIQPHGYYNIER